MERNVGHNCLGPARRGELRFLRKNPHSYGRRYSHRYAIGHEIG